MANLTAAAVAEFTGDTRYRDGQVVGHAKILVDRANDRDMAWLTQAGGAE